MAVSSIKMPSPKAPPELLINMPSHNPPPESIVEDNSSKMREYVGQFMSDSEYEEIETDKAWIHATAGALAGVGEHCVMYPMDFIKTRMMALTPHPDAAHTSIFKAAKQICAREGRYRLWRGCGIVFFGAMPAHAGYFAAYEIGKTITGKRLGHTNPFSHLLAGAGAALVHDAFMTPTDAIKQRQQVYHSKHGSAWACARSMVKHEGFRSFYRTYGTQICMNVPQQGLHFMFYEKLKRWINPKREYRPWVHVGCGALAGGCSAFITTPFDVCKTLLNTQVIGSQQKQPIKGLWNGLTIVWKTAGLSGLYKGCIPRTVHVMPSTGICWGVYESFKHFLKS